MDSTDLDSLAHAGVGEGRDDLSALAWVLDELRRSLETAHKSLRRFVKETEAMGGADIDAVDPLVLRTARNQLHQGGAALELLGLPAAAAVLRASEMAVQRFAGRPHKLTGKVVDDIERASFALLDYLGRLLAGKSVSTLALFPQYRAVQEAAAAERVHPADLWAVDWRWRELPFDPGVAPLQPDAVSHRALEAQLLALMRGGANPLAAVAGMSDLCAGLGLGAPELHTSTLWKLASAVFEAQAKGLLGFDLFSKRVASRLLAQHRTLEKGGSDVSERLAQDLLFFCAQSASPGDGRSAPRLAVVRQVYGLVHHTPADYSVSPLGRFDPALIVQARKRVAAAKEAWSAVAGGEMHRLEGLSEQFALVADSLQRLFPFGESFGAELQQAVQQTQQAGAEPAAPLAMEVATSLLYIEAVLEDIDVDNPEQAERVQRLAERLANVRRHRTPDPLEAWMEELYRRVSERQTMGSVVRELRASLSESEKLIDKFFRKPEDRNVLIPVPHQLSAMRGVLSVLGMDHASQALLRMRDEVDGLVSTEVDPERVTQAGVFDRLACNLGALGFLIDMLGVQPRMAKSLFVYDAEAGTLSPVMGRGATHAPPIAAADVAPAPAPVEQRLIEQAQMLAFSSVREDVSVEDVTRDLEWLSREARAADQPGLAATVLKAQEAFERSAGPQDLAAARGELSEALVDFVASASEPVGLGPEPVRRGRVTAPISLDFGPAELEDDAEMREVFLEEAREVLEGAVVARAELQSAPAELGPATTLRRALHTLKSSGRMVGLTEFGEAAWLAEQRFNTHLADQQPAGPALLDFSAWTLAYLSAWVDEIAERRPGTHNAAAVNAAADALAAAPPVSGPAQPAPGPVAEPVFKPTFGPIVESVAEPAAELVPWFGLPPGLPSAADLDLGPPRRSEPVPEPELSFEFDLAIDAPDLAGLPGPELLPFDAGAEALADPFDAEATEPLPRAEVSEAPIDDAMFEGLDLDLDFGTEAPDEPLLQSLAPSRFVDVEPAAVFDAGVDLEFEPVEAAAPDEDDPAPGFETEAAAPDAAMVQALAAASENDNYKYVGPLRIGIALFNIYLNEADELSRRLTTEVAEWAMELQRPIGDTPIALAHSLAGSSATVGFSDLSQLARALEHAQARSSAIGHGTADEARLFIDAAEEIRRLLHQFAAGFLKAASPELLERLAQHERSSAVRLSAAIAAAELPRAGLDPFPDEQTPTEPTFEAAVGPDLPALVMDSARPDLDDVALPAEALPGHHFDPLGVTDFKPFGAAPGMLARPNAPSHVHDADDDDIDAVDAVDAELFSIFDDEAGELLPQLTRQLRDWARRPTDADPPAACMRSLHTLKGGARLAGAMRLGEMAHRLETRIEHLLAHAPVQAAAVEALQGHGDALMQTLEALRSRDQQAEADAAVAIEAAGEPAPLAPIEVLLQEAPARAVEAPEASVGAVEPMAAAEAQPEAASQRVPGPAAAAAAEPAPIDWSRFAPAGSLPKVAPDRAQTGLQSAVRVRAPLLDRLVNQAGEVSMTRSRIAASVVRIKGSLGDLTDNLERLRGQLRDIEFQAETQMSSRLEAAKAAPEAFDPLESDRFTRFQELTRMMAESVNDVATVQRSLRRSLETAEDELAAQARLTRDLQNDLLRTRMVEFEGLSDRLYRVVRQAAKETGKAVRLDIIGGSIEVDRGVLDRMTGAFEHLLRNGVTHGIEAPAVRSAAGKEPTGTIIVALSHEGNEVGVEFRDDGAGLNLDRIRAKAVALGLIGPGADPSDADLANLIFTPGFSTAESVTELAGRGVGMDVVRSDVNAMGGRIETATAAGLGTSFKMILPLTTAVTQVLMLRCGDVTVAVPSTLVEIVRRATPAEIDEAYASGSYPLAERTLQFFWLGSLLQTSARPQESSARTRSIVVVRSAQQRIALHVDEVLGHQEVVVKNLGPQLAKLPGLAGVTLLASGVVALIYNPVALATLYGDAARAATHAALHAARGPVALTPAFEAPAEVLPPLVLVVDDSLTVRRVMQRLLLREGYRVVLAKDGLDALERLAEEIPQVVLSDIEMPRMDGFDLVRNMRADARLRELPVIMITSRIAQKHREHAAELGVDHYLGKPYSEEDLLALVTRYTVAKAAVL